MAETAVAEVLVTPVAGNSLPPAMIVNAMTAATRTATMASLRESRDGEVTPSTMRAPPGPIVPWGAGKWYRSRLQRGLTFS